MHCSAANLVEQLFYICQGRSPIELRYSRQHKPALPVMTLINIGEKEHALEEGRSISGTEQNLTSKLNIQIRVVF